MEFAILGYVASDATPYAGSASGSFCRMEFVNLMSRSLRGRVGRGRQSAFGRSISPLKNQSFILRVALHPSGRPSSFHSLSKPSMSLAVVLPPAVLAPVVLLALLLTMSAYRMFFTSPHQSRRDFSDYVSRVETHLEKYPSTSKEVRTAMHELQNSFPAPPSEIVESKVWGKAYLRVNSHLKSDHANAVANIVRAGHVVSPVDEKYLRLILTHWCSWSATDSIHMRDSWIRYLQASFELDDLSPILDSLVWPEEIPSFPKRHYPPDPSFFLLATPMSYYLFILEDHSLLRAGESLREVYDGLKEGRFHCTNEGDWKR